MMKSFSGGLFGGGKKMPNLGGLKLPGMFGGK
jgi:hypothetical protein